MDKPDAFDLLVEYPIKHNLPFETSHSLKRFYFAPNDPMTSTKFVLFEKNGLLFYAYDSYSTKMYSGTTTTGIYSILDLQTDIECKVYKRDWFDFLFYFNRKKSDIASIDKHLTLTSRSEFSVSNLLSTETTTLFLELYRSIPPISLLIQNNYFPFIKQFSDKKIIGLETNQWLFKEEDITILLEKGEAIFQQIRQDVFSLPKT